MADKSYLNFDLKIDRDSASGEYLVAVAQSPVGETTVPGLLRLPFGAAGLENRLLKLKLALRNAGLTRKTAATPEEQEVQHFGGELFGAAFNDDVLALYRSSIRQARSEGKGLRLRMRISSPELAALPWEFLYDPNTGDYVCLSVNTPIVRYLDVQQSADPLTVTLPLRILGMIAAPTDLPRLDVDAERTRIEESLGELIHAGRVALDWLSNSTHGALQSALNRHNYHIFHFIGHGGFDQRTGEGMLALTRDDGKAQLMPATNLARFLEQAGMLRLAFLNACEGATSDDQDVFSSTAATLVRRGIPAVLAMQYEITDNAAKLFARVFYEGIADGIPVDAAVSQARIALTGEDVATLEWGTPVLTMRAPDGVLFRPDSTIPVTHPNPELTARQSTPSPVASAALLPKSALSQLARDDGAFLQQAIDLVNNERFAEAIPILETLEAAKYRLRAVSPMLAQARQDAQEYERRRQIEVAQSERRAQYKDAYDEVAFLARNIRTLEQARKEWAQFKQDFPNWQAVLGGDIEQLTKKLKTPYEHRIDRSNPSALFFLFDQSYTMNEAFSGASSSKAAMLATTINRTLNDLILRCTRGAEVENYLDVALIGYGNRHLGITQVGSVFSGMLADRDMVSLSELADYPIRIENRTRKVDDGAGNLVDMQIEFPVWIDPVADSEIKPITEALAYVYNLISDWVMRHPDSFPPIVIHVTDGEPADDPRTQATALRSLSTSDGNVLLLNFHLSKLSGGLVFPNSLQELPDDYARILFEMSSPVPTNWKGDIEEVMGISVKSHARTYFLNADFGGILRLLLLETRQPTTIGK